MNESTTNSDMQVVLDQSISISIMASAQTAISANYKRKEKNEISTIKSLLQAILYKAESIVLSRSIKTGGILQSVRQSMFQSIC